jgi:ribosomal-protein-alanine N-acetyltransferase
MIAWIKRLIGPAKPNIEIAGARDAASFAALHKVAFARGWNMQEFEALLIERNAVAHRLRLNKRIIGFIISRIAADEAEILSVVIDGAFRGRGLAGGLLWRHLAQLAGQGVNRVFLEVEQSNAAARRLYARTGFREIATRQGYYRDAGGQERAAVVMQRDLA